MPCPSTGPKMFCAGPNFLCLTKIILILCPSQTFCAIQKGDLQLVNSGLVLAQNIWSGTKCSSIFGLAQNIWTSPNHFGTCERTKH